MVFLLCWSTSPVHCFGFTSRSLTFFTCSSEDLNSTCLSIYSLFNLSFFFNILQLVLLIVLLVFNTYLGVFKFGFTEGLPSEGIGVCPFEGLVVDDLGPSLIYCLEASSSISL